MKGRPEKILGPVSNQSVTRSLGTSAPASMDQCLTAGTRGRRLPSGAKTTPYSASALMMTLLTRMGVSLRCTIWPPLM